MAPAPGPPITVDQPYLEQQAIVVGFLEGALQGDVPRVEEFTAPTLDFDGDGAHVDGDPNDPAKQ